MAEHYRHPEEPFDIICPKCGHRAVFRLTAGVSPKHETPRYREGAWHAAGPEWGVCQCDRCVSRTDHLLQWPNDAYWRTSVRGLDLWGHTRAEVSAMIAYVTSAERDLTRFPEHAYFLRHVPRPLLSAKRREEVVKRLSRLLEEKTCGKA